MIVAGDYSEEIYRENYRGSKRNLKVFVFFIMMKLRRRLQLTRYWMISSQLRTEYTTAANMERDVMASQGMRNCCLLFTPPSMTIMLANRSMATLKRTRIRFRLMVDRLDR